MMEMNMNMENFSENIENEEVVLNSEEATSAVTEEGTSAKDAVNEKSRGIRFGKKSNAKACKEEELQNDLAESKDKYLRLFSEFDNYRKRTQREKADLLKMASAELLSSLLPVLDDFDRASVSMENSTDIVALREGVSLIQNKFSNILKQNGLELMDSMGKVFDTDYHEAITNIPAPTEDLKGKVVDVIQKGYLLQGKVLRYAKVVVGS